MVVQKPFDGVGCSLRFQGDSCGLAAQSPWNRPCWVTKKKAEISFAVPKAPDRSCWGDCSAVLLWALKKELPKQGTHSPAMAIPLQRGIWSRDRMIQTFSIHGRLGPHFQMLQHATGFFVILGPIFTLNGLRRLRFTAVGSSSLHVLWKNVADFVLQRAKRNGVISTVASGSGKKKRIPWCYEIAYSTKERFVWKHQPTHKCIYIYVYIYIYIKCRSE